jgi:two-component system NtrC family sensor kinase
MPTECFVPEDQHSDVRAHEEAALGGEPQSYEGVVLRGDGDRRIVAINTAPLRDLGEVTGVVASMRDVTDERSARDAVALSESRYRSLFDSARARAIALERSEARYTRLVESASDAIFTVDEQGRFTAVNRTLEQAVGHQRESLIGAGFADLLDPRDLAAAQELLRETYAGNRSRGAVRYRNAAGEVRHGSVITSPVFEDERIVGALGIMRDVTDERRLADQVLQQEKFVAVGQLVSGVAHELNNPLAGVMAFAQLLLASPLPLSDEPRQAVETIHREAQRAAKIVSSLLTFARQQPAERAAAQLNDIVADTVELRRHALRTAGITLSLQLDPTLPATWADPFQLQQVVLNLLGNAEQALANWAGERMIRIRTAREAGGKGGNLVIAVSDTGPGIAREQQDRVFNPFFTTKPVGQGTGLGLSISDGIVREHGGRIRVDSAPESGATFVVEIPHVVPPRQEEVVETARPAMPVASRRMLVVDDEPSMRAAVSRFLESLGHVIHVASSGIEARALMATTDYDVVLLDLRMPGLGGEALYRELTERDPRHARRVVFVTGDLQSDDAQRFLHETGRPVIGKPFQLDDLAAVLSSVNA